MLHVKKPGKKQSQVSEKRRKERGKDGIQRTLVFVEMISMTNNLPYFMCIQITAFYGEQTSSTINFSYNQKVRFVDIHALTIYPVSIMVR